MALFAPSRVVQIAAGAFGMVIALAARLVSVGAPLLTAPRLRPVRKAAIVVIMTRAGGLRGAISIAPALSLPPLPGRGTLVSTTYDRHLQHPRAGADPAASC